MEVIEAIAVVVQKRGDWTAGKGEKRVMFLRLVWVRKMVVCLAAAVIVV